MKLLDGGISDSIPIFAFRRMGYRKNIVVLTRPEGYRKKQDRTIQMIAAKYREYPEFVRRCAIRHMYYNKTLDKLAEMERKGQVLIIKPTRKLKVGRLEKNLERIQAMYDLGFFDAEARIGEIKEFLKGGTL